LSSDVSVIADDPVEAASVMAKKYSAVVVLKGATTVIASPKGDLAVSPFGHPGMATAGTGDVLAGLLGAWLSTATDPFVRSCAAVGIHGLTGEITGNEKGVGMIASDLVEYLPTSLQRLHMMGFAR
jgi:NAD(P)H-hydrate epimerase